MRVVVTGGAGFIGSHLTEELLRRGASVVVVDDFSSGNHDNLNGLKGALEVASHSITDPGALSRSLRGSDFVLHLAARTSVPKSVADPVESNRVNIDGTLNVLVAARDARVRRVVLAASSSVYGETSTLPKSVADPVESNRINIDGTLNVLVAARDARVRRVVFAASSSAYGETSTLPKSEAMRPDPISPYGVTKFAGELYAQVFARCYGLETVSLRYFNIFGPRQDPGSPYSGVLSLFITALLEGRQPLVYGDGDQSRDFTFVANAVDATIRAMEAPGVSGLVFNAGTGSRVTLNQTLALLAKISGKPAVAKYDPPRPGDIRDSQADVSLARQMLGYVPSVDFEEGLRRTWAWYHARHAAARMAHS